MEPQPLTELPQPISLPPCTQQRHGELSLPGECGAEPTAPPSLPPTTPSVCPSGLIPHSFSHLLSLPSFSLSPSSPRVQGPPSLLPHSVSCIQTCSSLPGLPTPRPLLSYDSWLLLSCSVLSSPTLSPAPSSGNPHFPAALLSLPPALSSQDPLQRDSWKL